MSPKRNENRFHGDAWFRQQMHLRVTQSLAEQQEAFAKEHKNDTDRQLLDYVRQCARELGKTPNAGEVLGGPYIAARFGSWEEAVRLAGLPFPKKIPQFRNRQLYQKEYKRQTALYKQQQAEKRGGAARREGLAEERREENKARLDADLAWGEAHGHLTDSQLLDILRQTALSLGHTPVRGEVEGGRYIAQHFGSWAAALELAGLELPKALKPAKPAHILQWRKRLEEADGEQTPDLLDR